MRIWVALITILSLMGCASVEHGGEAGGIASESGAATQPPPPLLVDEAGEATSPTPAEYSAAMRPDAPFELRKALVDKLPRLTIDDDGTPRTRILWEGDQLLTRAQVFAQLATRDTAAGDSANSELRVMVDRAGRPTFWPWTNRALTYWINPASFRTAEQLEDVRANLKSAAADWEAACPTCALTIREVQTQAAATFKVQFLPGNRAFAALAFFPFDPPWRRVLYVAPDYFTTTFSRAGIMRHELGHVLGYRHEHIVGVAGCYREDNRWRALTAYDPKSVMHYFCGGGGTGELVLSQQDIIGHQRLYGWRE